MAPSNPHLLKIRIAKYEKKFRELCDIYPLLTVSKMLNISYDKAMQIRDELGIAPRPRGYAPRPRLKKTCSYCKETFYVIPSKESSKYCSRPCANRGREITWVTGWREAREGRLLNQKRRKEEKLSNVSD